MSANDMFVKIMEIPDSQIIPYFESCTTCEIEEIAKKKKDLEKYKEQVKNISSLFIH